MDMPYFNSNSNKPSIETLEFRGFDNSNEANYKTLVDTVNMSSDEFPYISTRKNREVISSRTNPQAIFGSLKLVEVSDGKLYYDGVEKGTVSTGAKSIVDMNGNVIVFPDKVYYDYVLDVWGTFTAPDIEYAVVWNNRVWGVYDQQIVASKLGDFKEWTTFAGIASDSYATDIAGNKKFKGIVQYQNHVTMFTEDKMYIMMGDKPSNFNYQDVSVLGSTNDKAIIEVNTSLFYLNRSGVQQFTGGMPSPVSLNIDNKDFVSAVCGSDKLKMYMCIYDGSIYELFTYDALYKIWYKEDNLNIIDFTFYDGFLYGLKSTGDLIKFNSGSELFTWKMELQEMFFYNEDKKKYVNRVIMNIDSITGVSNIYIKYDKGEYVSIGKLEGDNSLVKFSVPIKRCDKFQIKVEGYGTASIKSMYKRMVWG